MAYFSWVEQLRNLSSASLTVRAQTIDPTDRGTLRYATYFPQVDVDTTEVNELVETDWRPVADRREWNTRGRHIPIKIPARARMEFVPIESYFAISEKEVQKLRTTVGGNEALYRDKIAASIPARTDKLAEANYRRLEVDAMTAWALGQVTVKNPQMGNTTTISLGYPATRYTTAGTAWDNAGVNAWDLFLSWIEAGQQLIGGDMAGAMMRQATFNAIRADAPNTFSPTATIRMSTRQIIDRLEEELNHPYTIIINEDSHDIFTDGGNDVVRTKVWPAMRVAAIPAGKPVGKTLRAPVVRAWDVANAEPDAGIDVRGMNVFNEVSGTGRRLLIECQGNYFCLPDEGSLYVINAGV